MATAVTVMIKKNLVVDLKTIEATLKYFLTEHSSRKYNYLYWNLIDPKHMSLCFVNLTGKKLNRLNNSELGFRIVKIANRKDWNIVKHLFENFIVSPDNRRAISVVRLDYLLQYLKTIKFNLDKIEFNTNKFGTKFVEKEVPGKKPQIKPISTIDSDIQSLYLLERLYDKYAPMIELTESNVTHDIADIKEAYIESDIYSYVLADQKLIVPTTDGLDIVAKRFTIKCDKSDESWSLQRIYTDAGLSNIVSKFKNDRMSLVSLRVYLKYFLKSIKKRRRKKS